MKINYTTSLLLVFFGTTSIALSQTRQTYNAPQSNYVSPNLDAFKQASEVLQKRHDENRLYKDNIQDWIYKIRKADQQNHLNTQLGEFQKELDYLESRGDWANLGNDLRSIENKIKRMLSDYEDKAKLNSSNINAEATRLNESGWKSFYGQSYEAAAIYFTQLINLLPNDPYGYYGRGAAKSNLGLTSEAIADYDKAISLNPSISMFYNNRGWEYFTINQFQLALNDLNQSLRLDNQNSIAWDSRAYINFSLNKYNECIEDAQKAILIDPDLASSYFIMGRANYRLGNKSLACKNWRQAKALNWKEAADFVSKYCK